MYARRCAQRTPDSQLLDRELEPTANAEIRPALPPS